MEQLVRIKSVSDDNTAQVVAVRESACSGDCHKCSGCGAVEQNMLFTAHNPIGARPGQVVTVSTRIARATALSRTICHLLIP